MSIVAEAPEYLQVFSNGHVKRFAPEIAEASAIPTHGFMSKDVIVDREKPVTARIFVPDLPEPVSGGLPVVVYFHGGGFCIGSTTWLGYHVFLGDFCIVSKCIVVSVDYRLAPENRLPVAYEDCFGSLEWIIRQVECDLWFKQADLSNVFLVGDSAGGNIAHNVAIKAITNEHSNVKIKGLMLIHPYFGSQKRSEKEMGNEAGPDVKSNDMFWSLSLPEGSNRDYSGCNFENAKLSVEQWRDDFPAVEVYIAGLDFLKERGVMYSKFLENKNVKKVTLVEAEGEKHVYHVFHPRSEATRLLQKQMMEFMRRTL